MRITEIMLENIGAASSDHAHQWASVVVEAEDAHSPRVSRATFKLHVTRRPSLTLGEIQAEAQQQVIELAKAILGAFETMPLSAWDNEGRMIT